MWREFFRNKSFYLIIIILLQPVVVGAGSFDRGILWEVYKSGQQNNYLLGTIHSDHPSILDLPVEVEKALNRSTSFTAELDLNLSSMLQAQMQLFLPEGKSLKQIVGPRLYAKSVSLMRSYGVPEMLVDRMKPWAIAAQLNLPKSKSGIFLDLKLHQIAQQKGLTTYGLETVAEQMSVFDKLSEHKQKIMLKQAIEDYPSLPGKIAKLIRYYLNRDLRGLYIYSQSEMKRADPAISAILQNKLVNERNHRMVNRMLPRLKKGKAFIAVGVLHLPGENGILQLLEDRGYQLRSVY
ncbi:MAG: TraB/GumN family protein [Thioalkalispiraceae bacterium]|jgi:uncharacterized protein YbaP (TraB family)